jgi:D-galactonate transporter
MDAIYRKVTWRFVPFLFICYIFNYLDRVNVGFAKLQMLDDLGMSETAYGLGAGIFFVGYVACGVPSNLMLERFGARRWLATIMVIWGLLSASLLFVSSPASFYALRFLTGAAEAGFFPGIVLFLSRWFPSARRGRVMAMFMAAIPLSGVIGGPLSGWMLGHFSAGQGGMAAWQWLFLLQGLPTVALGIVLLFVLPESRRHARWLDDAERNSLEEALAEDDRERPAVAAASFGQVLARPDIWLLGTIYFCIQSGVYAINFWLPSIIRGSGFADAQVIGWLSALPYLAAALFMLLVGRSADRRRERRWHLAGPILLGAGGLALAVGMAASPVWSLAGLTLAAMGTLSALPIFWPLAGRYLVPATVAAGLAFINSLGQVAGFLSPYFVGWMKDATGGTEVALGALATILLVGGLIVLRFPAAIANR